MKQKKKYLNAFTTLVLLVLALLCFTNVTYSYFTATENKEGNVQFGNLNVRFVYIETSGGSIKYANSDSIKLFSATGPIQREEEFTLSLTNGGAVINNLGIQNQAGCACYVRFWIDAYIVKNGVVNTDENYGKYFFLNDSVLAADGRPVLTREDSSVAGSWCYYFPHELTSSTAYRGIGNKLTLKDVPANGSIPKAEVPVELLGQELQLTISFEAVQVANNAYLSVFGDQGDTKGYYTGWSETEEW